MRQIALFLALIFWAPAAGAARTGQDVSYPQCGQSVKAFPFNVVGINGGRASTANPCFALEYAQARSPQLYVNSGNPGSVLAVARNHGTWPTRGSDIDGVTIAVPATYGNCHGDDSAACAYVYGYRMAERDIADAVAGGVVAPEHMRWWIDVETFNSWETDTPAGQSRDVADLEGMVAALSAAHPPLTSAVPLVTTDYGGAPLSSIGLYSTDLQWSQITGGQVSSSSPLAGLDQWQAGATTASGASAACNNSSFAGTSGTVWMTQFTDGLADGDVACRAF